MQKSSQTELTDSSNGVPRTSSTAWRLMPTWRGPNSPVRRNGSSVAMSDLLCFEIPNQAKEFVLTPIPFLCRLPRKGSDVLHPAAQRPPPSIPNHRVSQTGFSRLLGCGMKRGIGSGPKYRFEQDAVEVIEGVRRTDPEFDTIHMDVTPLRYPILRHRRGATHTAVLVCKNPLEDITFLLCSRAGSCRSIPR